MIEVSDYEYLCAKSYVDSGEYLANLEEAIDLSETNGGCKEGEKMVFGICRPTDGSKGEEETKLEGEASKQKSDVTNNKQVSVGGKKYGWAKKGGKPILVEWGSVAGTKAATAVAPAKAAAPAKAEPEVASGKK